MTIVRGGSKYHPSETITNNQATINTADLAYESHGKCGCQTIILSDLPEEEPTKKWEADRPQDQPSIPGTTICEDYSHVYKIVALSNTKFRGLKAENIAQDQLDALVFSTGAFKLMAGHEILANFVEVEINSGTCILYRNCQQS